MMLYVIISFALLGLLVFWLFGRKQVRKRMLVCEQDIAERLGGYSSLQAYLSDKFEGRFIRPYELEETMRFLGSDDVSLCALQRIM